MERAPGLDERATALRVPQNLQPTGSHKFEQDSNKKDSDRLAQNKDFVELTRDPLEAKAVLPSIPQCKPDHFPHQRNTGEAYLAES